MRYLLTFAVFGLFSFTSVSQNADIDLLYSINKNESAAADNVSLFFTRTVAPVGISTPIVMFTVSLFNHDSVLRSKSYCAAVAIIGTTLISSGLKYSVNRTRPYVTYPFINRKGDEFTPSFPSGHTATAFCTATSLSLLFPKWYVIVPSYAWACAAAYSRMYLGVHYPTDVLAGMVIGTGSAYLSWKAQKWLLKKRTEHKVNGE